MPKNPSTLANTKSNSPKAPNELKAEHQGTLYVSQGVGAKLPRAKDVTRTLAASNGLLETRPIKKNESDLGGLNDTERDSLKIGGENETKYLEGRQLSKLSHL